MFNKVLICIMFCSVIISCENNNQPESIKSEPIKQEPLKLESLTGAQISLQLTTQNIAAAVGVAPDGQVIVLNSETGKIVDPCKSISLNTKQLKPTCNIALDKPSKQVIELIRSTGQVYPINVLKNGQKLPAQLTLIANIAYKDAPQSYKGTNEKKLDTLSFMDSIISSASAQTVSQYCTTIYSAGSEFQTCITVGNSCKIWEAAMKNRGGRDAVISYVPACAEFI